MKIFDEVYEHLRSSGRDLNVLGIMGTQGAGKTTFAHNLSDHLSSQGFSAIPWNSDFYHLLNREERTKLQQEERARKEAGQGSYKWANQVYAIDASLLQRHIRQFKAREDFAATLCHPRTKSLDMDVSFTFDGNNWVSVYKKNHEPSTVNYGSNGSSLMMALDGVHIGLDEVRSELDHLIYVDAPFEIRAERVRKRLIAQMGKDVLNLDLFRDVDTFLESDYGLTRENATMIIDNSDFNNPKIVKG